MYKPLAERMRPESIEDFVGQEHIVGKGKPLYNLIKNKKILNCILYGPPGTGKTTLANIMANYVDKKFYKLNATTSSVKDIQEKTTHTLQIRLCPHIQRCRMQKRSPQLSVRTSFPMMISFS